MSIVIRLRINGRTVPAGTDPDRLLLWFLRGDLQMTGTKYGCGVGICGACTVLAGGEAIRSCVTTVGEVRDREIISIEGLAHGGTLNALQRAFIAHGALQCGFCTSGMLLNAQALLLANPRPSREEIRAAMDHNLCRCGAHQRILDAIESVTRPAEFPL